jgi:hypothetical protein
MPALKVFVLFFYFLCRLAHASVAGCKKIGTALIERSSSTKAYVSAANSFKETPIHKAVFNKYVRNFMVELLIKFDAELDVRNDKSETPLHYAVRLGREDLTRMLVEAGADSSLKTKAGQTPLALAQEYARSGAPEATNIEKLLSQIDGSSHVRVCIQPAQANSVVRIRNEGHPYQSWHFGHDFSVYS